MKNTLKKVLSLILFFVLILVSCEKEETVISQEAETIVLQSTIQRVGLETLPLVKSRLQQIKQCYTAKLGAYRTVNDFTLDEESVMVLEREDGFTSYSFRVETTYLENEPYYLENLNIEIREDSDIAFITKWIPEDGLLFTRLEDFSGTMQVIDLDDKILAEVTIDKNNYTSTGTGDAEAKMQSVTIDCVTYYFTFDCFGIGSVTMVDYSDCSSGGGGSGYTPPVGGTSSGDYGGGSSTSNTPGTSGGSYGVNTLTEEQIEMKWLQFYGSLSSEKQQVLNANLNTKTSIFSYLKSKGFILSAISFVNKLIDYASLYSNINNQQVISQIIEKAINNINNGKNCVILPTVFSSSEFESNFDSNLFGDYLTPNVQQNHDAIQQQFNNLRNTNDNLAAVNYLISTYNMNTFGPNSVAFNYSISFADGLQTGDHANAIRGFDSNGNLVSCELQIDTNLLLYADFGYITRVIKHELYHVLQGEFYGQNGLSNAAQEFDAYYSQIFRFNDLKKIQDMSLVYGLAELMINYMKQMSTSEKTIRQDMINNVQQIFPELCKN